MRPFFVPVVGFAQKELGTCEAPIYEERARELEQIVNANQGDRKIIPLPPDVLLRDQKRRMRMGEIFWEGCLKTAMDLAAAALVFQHGKIPAVP